MIIIASREGQFANRVLHFQHILAFCLTHQIPLKHAYFDDYLQYFPHLAQQPGLNISRSSGYQKALNYFVRLLLKLKITRLGNIEFIPYLKYEQGDPAFNLEKERIAEKARKKTIILYGWLFRSPADVEKHAKKLNDLFAFPSDIIKSVSDQITPLRSGYDLLVGVHLRRGDYKNFVGGRWYYEDDVYQEKMDQVQAMFPGRKLGFVLCSNEKLDIQKFAPHQVHRLKGDFMTDFLALSNMDYIIGPPSTFSVLASHTGKVPLQFIQEKTSHLSLDQFKVATI